MKRLATVLFVAVAGSLVAPSFALSGNERSEAHQKYVATVWEYIDGTDYQSWPEADGPLHIGVGPWLGQKTFVDQKGDWEEGSTIISENWDGEKLSSVSIFMKQAAGYSVRNKDWYWVHFTADGKVVSASPDKEEYRKPGYVTWVIDGRLWLFVMNSTDAADFVKSGDLAKNVTRIAAGPDRMSVRSSNAETIDAYLAAKEGFFVWPVEGRLWVYHSDDPALADFLAGTEPAKVVIRPGAGPDGVTLKATETETLDAYIAAREGFATFIEDGRIWVFKADAEELAAFQRDGEIAKSVTRPGAGPAGMTVRAPDAETLDAYLN